MDRERGPIPSETDHLPAVTACQGKATELGGLKYRPPGTTFRTGGRTAAGTGLSHTPDRTDHVVPASSQVDEPFGRRGNLGGQQAEAAGQEHVSLQELAGPGPLPVAP